MTLDRMCALASVSRAGLYRFQPDADQLDGDMELRMPSSGSLWNFPAMGVRALPPS